MSCSQVVSKIVVFRSIFKCYQNQFFFLVVKYASIQNEVFQSVVKCYQNQVLFDGR